MEATGGAPGRRDEGGRLKRVELWVTSSLASKKNLKKKEREKKRRLK